ncbi:MAG: TIGR03016 family PEP-CTERM system-associated outer membrane protein [Gammaproteobacteria bacterium]|nr:TIGR03016 family PEP-CTERM system-associated outer membrane protein [Gammaproteobacteria bacterium]
MSLSETYTDNVFQAPSDIKDDFITNIAPGVSLTSSGRRIKTTTFYRMQNQFFANNGSLNQTTNFLGSNSSIEVIKNNLFVDGYASMFPTQENSFGRISNQNRRNLGNGNQVDVISYGMTPRYIYRFGSWATFRASTSFSTTTATRDNGTSNVGGNGSGGDINLGLTSGSKFSILTWNINHRQRFFNFDSGTQRSNLQSTDLGLGYRVNRYFRINASIGTENNSFAGNQNQRSGLSWSLGGTWTPTPRTSISGRFGKRSFGDTKSFDFSYRLRRVRIGGSYTEDLHTTSELLQQQQVFQTRDIFGNPIANPNPTGDIVTPIRNLGLLDQVFVSRTFSANFGFQQKRGSITASIYRSEQQSTQTNSASDQSTGVSVGWQHRLSNRLSTGITADYQQRKGSNQGGNQGRNQNSFFVSPSLSYSISAHLSSQLSFRHSEERGGSGFFGNSFGINSLGFNGFGFNGLGINGFGSNDFVENSLTGSLNYRF